MNRLRPTGVSADRNTRIVTITWSDGHLSKYPYAGLRAICPCAECRGGHAHMGQPPDPRQVRDTVNDEIDLAQVGAAGNYALQFAWSDGHSAGIYTWEYLRQACPCKLCLE